MAQKDAATVLETEDKVLITIVKANEWIFNKDKKFAFNEHTKAILWHQIRAQLAEAGFNVTGTFSLILLNYEMLTILLCSWSHTMYA